MIEILNQNQLESKMHDLVKKIEIIKKKKERMGLSSDENDRYNKLLVDFFLYHDELIDLKLEEWVFTRLYDSDSLELLDIIKQYIPWDGKLISRAEDAQKIIDAEAKLNDSQRNELINALEALHHLIILEFEEFATDEGLMDFLKELSIFVAGNESGNILDVLKFVDMRYRVIGELIGFELPDIEVDFI